MDFKIPVYGDDSLGGNAGEFWFGILKSVHCDLFEIWILVPVISILPNKLGSFVI